MINRSKIKSLLPLLLTVSLSKYSHAQVSPLDYSNVANWSAHPDKLFDLAINPSLTLISKDTLTKTKINYTYPPANAKADIFVVSPTTLINSGSPPSTVPLNVVQKSAINLSIQLGFSQYGRLGRIYAPYYRQANLALFSMPLADQNLQAAILDTACSDVLAAFIYYVDHNNTGKKIICVGHSQGAIILSMMIQRMESNPAQYSKYLKKIFCSVQIGMEGANYVKMGILAGGWNQTFPYCNSDKDTNCILSWMTVKDGLLFLSSTPFGNYVPQNAACIPLNLKYQAFNSSLHEASGYSFSYSNNPKPVTRSIFPTAYIASGAGGVTTEWVAFDQFYQARIAKPNSSAWGIAVEHTPIAGDYRFDPIASVIYYDLHLYDQYIIIEDVIQLLQKKLDLPSALNDVSNSKIKIYPNPAENWINIDANEMNILNIYTLEGKLINSYYLNDDLNSLDISFLPSSIYILSFDNGQKIKLTKL